eukprot:CAMPEP_0172474080 /NCGR_PEP_ID=MMETSP1065-20121228/69177_1 /TAXON_ID=265537 /ORGANISM="Amphiprora paludosa, Strain CCMP125" /LENGTH=864 /DNA_ID=CAMNT_0013232257 /DNA_START=77 /DNA_END=2671 /DNA_ORIENTATION=+
METRMERSACFSRKRQRQQHFTTTQLSTTPCSRTWLQALVVLLLWNTDHQVEGFLTLTKPFSKTGFHKSDSTSASTGLFQNHNRQHHQKYLNERRPHLLLNVVANGFDEFASSSSASSSSLPASTSSSSTAAGRSSSSSATANLRRASSGLSRFHQSILSRTSSIRQCFVTGRYPLLVSFRDCPTRKWLQWESTSELLVNQTTLQKSLASVETRFQWLDSDERQELIQMCDMMSVEFLAEIHVERPGYLQMLPSCHAGASAQQQPSNQDASASPAYTFFQKSTSSSMSSTTPSWARRFDVSDCPALVSDRLWVTGFSLAGRTGHIYSMNADSGDMGSVNARTRTSLLWPNEVAPVPSQIWQTTRQRQKENEMVDWGDETVDDEPLPCQFTTDDLMDDFNDKDAYEDALLVADGFLVPGKDRGGLYVVKHPGNRDAEWTVQLTSSSSSNDRWFYHRASWVDLTGDGRRSILTARCRVSTRFYAARNKENGSGRRSGGSLIDDNAGVTSGIVKEGQLVWLECPQPHRVDPATGTPLEEDGTVFDPFSAIHLPWKEQVLATGPDVMFCLADLDPHHDDTIEVLCSEFFNERVTLRSIRKGPQPKVVFERTIDDRCGAAFGCIPANLDLSVNGESSSSFPTVIDSGSTVRCLKEGDRFSHLLVTSHECTYAEQDRNTNTGDSSVPAATSTSKLLDGVSTDRSVPEGGSLFAYRVPQGRPGAWKTDPWVRTTVATGFKVEGQLGNMINPGAPGFVYTFHATDDDQSNKNRRPLIAVAGDCAESAYLFRPNNDGLYDGSHSTMDLSASYKLMVEIKCGATVGSIGVGYDEFLAVEQDSGYAKLYIPCFEKDKILVFALGSGDDGYDDDDW